MEVITIVSGKIPASKMKEFEASYVALKHTTFSPGIIKSSLLKSNSDPESYRIETVWESKEALEKMRASSEPPVAPTLFKKVGAVPNLEIFDCVCQLP